MKPISITVSDGEILILCDDGAIYRRVWMGHGEPFQWIKVDEFKVDPPKRPRQKREEKSAT